jgi:hypothetical protein
MQNGKGDKPRPVLNRKQYEHNWEEINWSSGQLSEVETLQEVSTVKESTENFQPFPEPLE